MKCSQSTSIAEHLKLHQRPLAVLNVWGISIKAVFEIPLDCFSFSLFEYIYVFACLLATLVILNSENKTYSGENSFLQSQILLVSFCCKIAELRL